MRRVAIALLLSAASAVDGGETPSLYGVSEGGKWGFVDLQGEWVVAPSFEFVEGYRGSRARVRRRGRWGFIDREGHVAVPLRYEEATDFESGRAWGRRDGRWFLLGTDGRERVIAKLENVRPFSEGLAAARVGGRWGFVDTTGAFKIRPSFEIVLGFGDGLAPARDKKLWGYVDRTGRWIVAPRFVRAAEFSDGLARATTRDRWVFLDSRGATVFERGFDTCKHVGRFAAGRVDVWLDKRGYLDRSGKVVIPPRFDNTWRFAEGMAPVCIDGRWGYIDARGATVIATAYLQASSFRGDIAAAQSTDRKWGLIDRTGAWRIEPRFESIRGFSIAPASQRR